MKKRIIIVCVVLAISFSAIIAYSGYQLLKVNANYMEEAEIHQLMLEYKPDAKQDQMNGLALTKKSDDTAQQLKNLELGYLQDEKKDDAQVDAQDNVNGVSEGIENKSVINLQQQYPDAVGWIMISNTKIDYPIVQYKDNDYYLRRDINGKYAAAGTIFIDFRCDKDFASQNTIIYGHHMKNKSIFGSLNYFSDQKFFSDNRSGIVYLSNDTLMLEVFAYAVVYPDDKEIFNPVLNDTFYSYVRQKARHYRDIGLTDSDRIVTLSTCAYEFDDARMVLLAKIK